MHNYEMRGVNEQRQMIQTFFFEGEEEGLVADHWTMESEETLIENKEVCFIEYYDNHCLIMVNQVIRVDDGETILLEV